MKAPLPTGPRRAPIFLRYREPDDPKERGCCFCWKKVDTVSTAQGPIACCVPCALDFEATDLPSQEAWFEEAEGDRRPIERPAA